MTALTDLATHSPGWLYAFQASSTRFSPSIAQLMRSAFRYS